MVYSFQNFRIPRKSFLKGRDMDVFLALIFVVIIFLFFGGFYAFRLWKREREKKRAAEPTPVPQIPPLEKSTWWNSANIRINPIQMYIIWAVVLLVVSGIVTFLFVGLSWFFELELFSSVSVLILWVVVLVALAFPMQDTTAWLTVPPNYAGVVTFLGMLTPFWLSEGEYPPINSTILFGIYQGPVKGLPPAPNGEAGLVYVGNLAFPVYDDPNTETKSTTVSNNSKDKLVVTTQFTFTIQIVNPRKWIRSDDAPLMLGDRARGALRDAVAFLPALDAVAMKSVFATLLMGDTILTSFIRKQVGKHPEGSVILNKQGQQLYVRVPRDTPLQPALSRFVTQLEREAQPKMLQAINSNIVVSSTQPSLGNEVTTEEVVSPSNLHLEISVLSIEKHIPEILEMIGSIAINVSVADFGLPKRISEEAEKAATEVMQREGQLQSAETQRLVREKLAVKEGEDTEAGRIAQLLAASQDNPNVRVNAVVVPGGDKLSRAAAVLGSQQATNQQKGNEK